MTKQSKGKPDPQDFAEEGKGLTPYQKARLGRIVSRIGKSELPDYRGGRGYQPLPGDA